MRLPEGNGLIAEIMALAGTHAVARPPLFEPRDALGSCCCVP